jgi:hypothetical protein
MHRSGTSAITRMVNLMGACLGEKLLQPMEGVNEEGFWENARVVDVNQRILHSMGSEWYDILPVDGIADLSADTHAQIADVLQQEFSGRSLIALKDPRICRLLPLWLDALQDVKPYRQPVSLIIVRDPLEVVRSLERRDKLPRSAGFLLWIGHVLDAELYSRAHGRMSFLYDQMLSALDVTVEAVARFLELPWPLDDAVTVSISEAIGSKHRHHTVDTWMPGDELEALALRLYRCYEDAFPGEPERDELGDIRAKYCEFLDRNRYGLEVAQQANDAYMRSKQQTSTLGKELAYARSVVEERDIQLNELNVKVNQIGQQHAEAIAMVQLRDSQLSTLQAQLQELGEAHGYAIKIVEERDQELRELNALVHRLQSHPLLGWLIRIMK